MDAVLALFVFAEVLFGAGLVLFNRRVSVYAFRVRQSLWKMDYSEFEVRVLRVFAVIIGALLLWRGLDGAARYLSA